MVINKKIINISESVCISGVTYLKIARRVYFAGSESHLGLSGCVVSIEDRSFLRDNVKYISSSANRVNECQ